MLTDHHGNNSTGWTYGSSLSLSDAGADVSTVFVKFCSASSPQVMCSPFQSLRVRRIVKFKTGNSYLISGMTSYNQTSIKCRSIKVWLGLPF